MRQRWVVFIAALTGCVVVAVGFAVAVDRAIASRGQAPRLHTASASTLATAGITLSAPLTPPYCGVEHAAAERGWLPAGAVNCPIVRSAAEAAAARGGGQVLESVLARVGTTGTAGAGHDRLMWLVVVRSSVVMLPMIVCARGPAVDTPCPPSPPTPRVGTTLVMLDAHSGQLVQLLALTANGGVAPWRQVPPTVIPPLTKPTAPEG
ncbi:MAG TPA: hypothetical protein VGO86_03725 [Candidatus Dormibacteraeota bacterium]